MKLEFETVYCGVDEKFIPFEGDVECLCCLKKKAVKITENYLEVDICYDNGGGSDVTKLYFCDLCYEKHVEKVKIAKVKIAKEKPSKKTFLMRNNDQIIYQFNY